MDRRVTPPTWGPPPPCKQALIRPLAATHFAVKKSYEDLVLDQGNNFYLISLRILITCLLDVRIF